MPQKYEEIKAALERKGHSPEEAAKIARSVYEKWMERQAKEVAQKLVGR